LSLLDYFLRLEGYAQWLECFGEWGDRGAIAAIKPNDIAWVERNAAFASENPDSA